jgi:hypothetical protein
VNRCESLTSCITENLYTVPTLHRHTAYVKEFTKGVILRLTQSHPYNIDLYNSVINTAHYTNIMAPHNVYLVCKGKVDVWGSGGIAPPFLISALYGG